METTVKQRKVLSILQGQKQPQYFHIQFLSIDLEQHSNLAISTKTAQGPLCLSLLLFLMFPSAGGP